MSSALLVVAWAAAGGAAGTVLGTRTWQLLATDRDWPVTVRLPGPVITAASFGILAWQLNVLAQWLPSPGKSGVRAAPAPRGDGSKT